MTFVDDYLNFIGEFPESKHRGELDGNYNRARKFLSSLTNSGVAAESSVEK